MLAPGILNSSIGPRPTLSWRATSALDALYPSLWNGLGALWCPGLGQTGNRIWDLSGRGHHATLDTVGQVWVTDEGPALRRTAGSTDTVGAVLDKAIGDVVTSTFSVVGYCKQPDLSSGLCTFIGANANSDNMLSIRDTNQLCVDGFNSIGVITQGMWSSYAGVRVGNYMTGYQDGKAIASPVDVSARTWNFSIIDEIHCNWFNSIDNKLRALAVYNRALTPWEIRLLARDPLAPLRRREPLGVFPAPASGATPWLYARQHGRIFGGGIC